MMLGLKVVLRSKITLFFCSVRESGLFSVQHASFGLSDSQTCVLQN